MHINMYINMYIKIDFPLPAIPVRGDAIPCSVSRVPGGELVDTVRLGVRRGGHGG